MGASELGGKKPGKNNFDVITNSGSEVQAWLVNLDNVAHHPAVTSYSGETLQVLFSKSVPDNFFYRLHTIVRYHEDSREFSLDTYLSKGQKRSFTQTEAEVGDLSLPASLSVMRQSLSRNLKKEGYQVDLFLNQEEEIVEIAAPKRIEDMQGSNNFTLTAEENRYYGNELKFSLRNPVTDDIDMFAACYTTYGRVLKEVITSAYELGNHPLPELDFRIAPNEDLISTSKSLEHSLEQIHEVVRGSELGISDKEIRNELLQSIFIPKPNDRFDDIGGLESQKRLMKIIGAGLLQVDASTRWGYQPPRGVLLVGEPGIGKTKLVRATANELGVNFALIGIEDILYGLVGASERRLRRVFDLAEERVPIILCIDEIDSFIPERNSTRPGVETNLVNVIATCMDGVVQRDPRMVVVGTTNLLDVVDKKLLRPKRFSKIITFEKPDQTERRSIIDIYKRKAEEAATEKVFVEGINTDELAKESSGLTGAELEDIFRLCIEDKFAAEFIDEKTSNPITTEELLLIIQQKKSGQSRKTMDIATMARNAAASSG